MSNKNSQIILEDNRNDFSFKKNKYNINISVSYTHLRDHET